MGCQLLEIAETAEEVVDARHNQGDVPQLTDHWLKLLGGGWPFNEHFADTCRQSDELVFGKGD